MVTWYLFKDKYVVKLIHKTNNQYAAEKAMLNAFRRTKSDVVTTCFGERCSWGVNGYQTFDGTNYH